MLRFCCVSVEYCYIVVVLYCLCGISMFRYIFMVLLCYSVFVKYCYCVVLFIWNIVTMLLWYIVVALYCCFGIMLRCCWVILLFFMLMKYILCSIHTVVLKCCFGELLVWFFYQCCDCSILILSLNVDVCCYCVSFLLCFIVIVFRCWFRIFVPCDEGVLLNGLLLPFLVL